MKNVTRGSKPKFKLSWEELVGINKLDDSTDYMKYKVAYHKWFKGLITGIELRKVIKSLI